MSQLIKPLDIDAITTRFSAAYSYQKTAVTLGRLPKVDEIDQVFITYVSDGLHGVREETRNIVSHDKVIARNYAPIIPGKYNEYLLSKDEWVNKYGELPLSAEAFSSHRRETVIKCILIDDEILRLIGSEDGESARIHVDWSDYGMRVYKGGFLTDTGYGISKQEMESSYERL